MRASAESCARLLILALTLVGSIGCSAATGTLDVESARIAAQVITALVNDPEIGTRPIDVRVTRGVVHMSGRVRTLEEMTRAIELARAVPGVTRVDSGLRIGADLPPDPNAPPTEQRGTMRDPAVEFAELEETRGRLAVGASFGSSQPTAEALGSRLSVGPIVRFGSGAGLGPALAFDWYRATLTSSDPSQPAGWLRVRPIMVGLAYSVVAGPVSVSPSIVGGYAFNRIAVPDSGGGGRLAVDVRNSLVWRPGVSIWIDTGRRTAMRVSIGRLMTRLNVIFIEDGRLEHQSLGGHATLVSVGLAYKLF
jgi:hypothetical protein